MAPERLRDIITITDKGAGKLEIPIDASFVLGTVFSYATTASFTGIKGLAAAMIVGAGTMVAQRGTTKIVNIAAKSIEAIKGTTVPFRLAAAFVLGTVGGVGGYIVSHDIVENGMVSATPSSQP